MKNLLLVAWTSWIAVGCKGEPAPATQAAAAKPVDTVIAPAKEPECCCAAKAFVAEDGTSRPEMMPARTCTGDFLGTCEPVSACAAPTATATASTSTCAPLKTGIAVGTTLDALENAYGDDLAGDRTSDNDPSGVYRVGPDGAPCITFTIAFVDSEHRITKITPRSTQATLDVSRAVKSLSGIVGTAVGENGAIAMPSCCLDCDGLVPELQKLASLASDLGAPVGAGELRAASAKVRAAPWATLFEATAYDDKTRKTFVARIDSLAGELETAARLLDGSSDAAPAAKKIAANIESVIASARELGKASREYCTHD